MATNGLGNWRRVLIGGTAGIILILITMVGAAAALFVATLIGRILPDAIPFMPVALAVIIGLGYMMFSREKEWH